MAILIDENTKVVVQGITGREGRIRAELMRNYGTNIVAGVTPGKAGERVFDIPVYNTVRSAKEKHPDINTSVIFAPPRAARESVMEAIDAGLKIIVLCAERVPQHDVLEMIAYARENGTTIIGPNTPGLISPGKSLVGMLGGTVTLANEVFKPGPVGVLSRSGGITTTICYYLCAAGIGQSTAVGIGGDTYLGSTWVDLLAHYEKDNETKVIAAYGEIGTSMEEDAAQYIMSGAFTKPMVVYISGHYAKVGVRFGHAGAIISGSGGSAAGKIQILKEAGVTVVDHFNDIGNVVKGILTN
jgi:succinyl-CoA synthetase alpha subunit